LIAIATKIPAYFVQSSAKYKKDKFFIKKH